MSPSPPLWQLVYVSRAAEDVDGATVQDIVTRSRVSNVRQGVTGALLYSGTHFAQVLEGPEDALRSLIASLALDSRHAAVRTLLHEPIESRRFGGWAMAYVCEVGLGDLVECVWSAPVVDKERALRLVEHLFPPSAFGPPH